MEYVLLTMIVLIVIVAVIASRLADNSYPFPFNRRETLFTQAEKGFQALLERAVGDKYRVVNRVRLADLVTVRNGVSKKATDKAHTLAKGKYLDFVICDRETMTPCGVIDLVNTQGKGYKVKKDWFVSGALEASNIPHIRVKVKNGYTVEEIRQCIGKHILGVQRTPPKIAASHIPAPLVRARSKKPLARPETESTALLPQSRPQPELAQLPH